MNKLEREKRVIEQMIRLYCRHKEGNRELCPTCTALLDYCTNRLSRCPFGEKKGACKDCPIHCYRPKERAEIRAVMRWVGPRMLFYHPIEALRHLFRSHK